MTRSRGAGYTSAHVSQAMVLSMKRPADDPFAASIDCVHPADELTQFLLHYFEHDSLRGKSVLDAACRTGELVSGLAGVGGPREPWGNARLFTSAQACRHPFVAH